MEKRCAQSKPSKRRTAALGWLALTCTAIKFKVRFCMDLTTLHTTQTEHAQCVYLRWEEISYQPIKSLSPRICIKIVQPISHTKYREEACELRRILCFLISFVCCALSISAFIHHSELSSVCLHMPWHSAQAYYCLSKFHMTKSLFCLTDFKVWRLKLHTLQVCIVIDLLVSLVLPIVGQHSNTCGYRQGSELQEGANQLQKECN